MGTRYGLLGEHLGHSFSPMLHGMMADYAYRLYEKSPEEVADFLQNGDFDGLNVTIPYKKTVIPYCTELSPAAAAIGSVNTLIRLENGGLRGDNTDYFGFLWMCRLLDMDFRGQKALVLGSGGASLTVCAVLRDLGADPVVTISRSGPDNYENLDRHADAAVIVNATPVGMYPNTDAAPVSLDAFPACRAVLDIIYNPARTQLMLEAEARGIPVIGGLPMLAAQAKRACELFCGSTLPDAIIAELTAAVARRTKNIVLIGMPGSGKSTVGALLCARTGRPLLDTDAMVVEDAGKSIPEIFADAGEGAFRALETAALRRAATGSGRIIATGGGVVTIPENRDILRRNSIVVFLDRPPEGLPTDGRPLSQSQGTAALYQARLPLYTAWCDLRVEDPPSAEDAAQTILSRLGLES